MQYLKDVGAVDENSTLQQEDLTLELEEQKLQLLESLLQLESQHKQRKGDIESRFYLMKSKTIRHCKSSYERSYF